MSGEGDSTRDGVQGSKRRYLQQSERGAVGASGLGATTGSGSAQTDDGGVCSDGARFCDDWSDGDYTSSPPWEITASQGDFSVDVRTMSSVPTGGSNVLHVTETRGGGSIGGIGWKNGQTGWETAWTLSGLFYTAAVPLSTGYQTHEVRAGGIKAYLGFTHPDRIRTQFALRGGPIDSVEESLDVDWAEQTWYHYEISHDGNGTFTGRLWEEGESRPSEAQARSTGSVPGPEPDAAEITINGAGGYALDVNHAYMRWEEGAPEEDQAVVQAATASTVHFVPGLSEDDSAGGNDNYSVFPNGHYGGPIVGFEVDPTRVGDHLLGVPTDLRAFVNNKKEVQPVEGLYNRYRVKNSIAVGFESPDGKRIENDSISVLVNGETPRDDEIHNHSDDTKPAFDVRHFSPDDPEKISYTILEEDELDDFVEDVVNYYDMSEDEAREYANSLGSLKKRAHAYQRFASAQQISVDRNGESIEGVRVSTIWGGVEAYIYEMMNALFRLGRDAINRISGAAPPIPIIYSWIELTVLADGTKIFRVPDASVFPKMACYFDALDTWDLKSDMSEVGKSGKLVGQNGLNILKSTAASSDPSKYEVAINEEKNAPFEQFLTETDQHATPYHGPRMAYLIGHQAGSGKFGEHPILNYGVSPDGQALSKSEICSILQSTTGSPRPLSPFELTYGEIIEFYESLYGEGSTDSLLDFCSM